MNPQVSIIIVHYKVKKLIFDCIWSIIKVKPKVNYEIIVVDNDEEKTIKNELSKKFSFVKYVESPGNIGYGAGMNLGAKKAKGKYLFILNSDTIILNNSIENLVKFLELRQDYALAGPQLLDKNHQIYELQGVKRLTYLKALFVLTFIDKYFPNNWIAKDYWMKGWNKKAVKDVDVIPGTAFVIRKEIFNEINGFDENFFLYFEEFDLCNRVKNLGYKIAIIPESKIVHLWGKSTQKHKGVNKIFQQSREYYFTKYYGKFRSKILELILKMSLDYVLIISILLLVAGIRLYKLPEEMFFIGDQGWFYLSARDLLMSHQIPLVGITSSHVWLHQGPIWTYILALGLLFANFNPIAGAIISLVSALLTAFVLFWIGKKYFNSLSGLLSAFFYAISPLMIMFDRMPYHTTLIPFAMTLLIFCLFSWVNNNLNYLPWIMLILALLYNLEISTSLMFGVVGIMLFYGYKKQKPWFIGLQNQKIKNKSILFFLIPMLPMLIYDFSHGFPQTFGYVAYVVYKIFQLITLHYSGKTLGSLLFLWQAYSQAVFPAWILVGGLIGLISIIYLIYLIRIKANVYLNIILLIFAVLVLGFMFEGTNSQAYLPMFLPVIFLLEGYIFSKIASFNKYVYLTVILSLLIVAVFNIRSSFTQSPYFPQISYAHRLSAAKQIIKQADGQKFSLIGKGPGSQFPSFTMNTRYLVWWLGDPAQSHNAQIKFILDENKTIKISKVVK